MGSMGKKREVAVPSDGQKSPEKLLSAIVTGADCAILIWYAGPIKTQHYRFLPSFSAFRRVPPRFSWSVNFEITPVWLISGDQVSNRATDAFSMCLS